MLVWSAMLVCRAGLVCSARLASRAGGLVPRSFEYHGLREGGVLRRGVGGGVNPSLKGKKRIGRANLLNHSPPKGLVGFWAKCTSGDVWVPIFEEGWLLAKSRRFHGFSGGWEGPDCCPGLQVFGLPRL